MGSGASLHKKDEITTAVCSKDVAQLLSLYTKQGQLESNKKRIQKGFEYIMSNIKRQEQQKFERMTHQLRQPLCTLEKIICKKKDEHQNMTKALSCMKHILYSQWMTDGVLEEGNEGVDTELGVFDVLFKHIISMVAPTDNLIPNISISSKPISLWFYTNKKAYFNQIFLNVLHYAVNETPCYLPNTNNTNDTNKSAV